MPQLTHLTVTPLYAGLLALLLVLTSVLVTVGRVKHKVSIGDGGNKDMLLRIRVQGNLIEYAPTALILMGLLELGGTAPWALHVLGLIFLVGRIMHAWTIRRTDVPRPGRGIGVTAGWIVIAVSGVLSIAMTQGWIIK
jgi:uncharacterized membrane protein YecN with MAPEG domain